MMLKNAPNVGDGVRLLEEIPRAGADLVFFDPQYRGVLDKLAYGNEGARHKKRVALPQMDDQLIGFFVEHIERVLKPSAYCCLWADKFTIGEKLWQKWMLYDFSKVAPFKLVDLIVWRKEGIGSGYRSRRASEYLLILQKLPVKARGTWRREPMIPDVWGRREEQDYMGKLLTGFRTSKLIRLMNPNQHPHAKPLGLQAAIIQATTEKKGLVVDPAAGGYSVLKACQLTGRNFIGCDLKPWRT